MAKKSAFYIALILGVVLFLEVALALLARVSDRIDELLTIPSAYFQQRFPDPVLNSRLNPELPEIDELGYRNESVPERANVVAFGDSLTYGMNAESSESWPKQLGNVSGKVVYNMGVGGYGPVHSLVLWDTAVERRPDLIIQAIYAGNDQWDSYAMVYERSVFPELKSTDTETQALLGTRSDKPAAPVTLPEETADDTVSPSAVNESLQLQALRASRVLRLFLTAYYELKQVVTPPVTADAFSAKIIEQNAGYHEFFDYGPVRTVFGSAKILWGIQLDDPRLDEGTKLILRSVEEQQRRATALNIDYLVLFLPTKEFVFQPFVATPTDMYKTIVEDEAAFWAAIITGLQKANIAYVNPLESLRAAIEAGINPYSENLDAHPNAAGYRAIAEAVNSNLSP